MKITITPSGGSKFVLADDSVELVTGLIWPTGAGGQIREGFVNKQKRQTQKSQLLRAGYQLNIPRFNLENRMGFTVQRAFATTEACVAFIAFHPDSVPTQGEVTLTYADSSGTITRYWPAAVVESVECAKHLGAACDFSYTLCGNGPWQTSP